ncbi:hypothetical protein Pve01_84500 [Planomonospora venezuelensis]|nr:hypothetical protein Pve01_84500 [Planomonospora venezuelensis]
MTVRPSSPGTLRPPEGRVLRRDVVAGITVAAYLVPQVLAYAGLARVPPEAGLWAAFVALAVYFLLGSSPQLSVGPESTTALMTGAALATITVPGASPRDTAALLALAVGAVCVLAWVGGLAFLSDLLSKPVLVGYMAGIAGLMILSQSARATGADIPDGDPLSEAWWLVQHPSAIHGPTLAVCLGTLAVLLVGARVWPTGPVPLAGMLAATAHTTRAAARSPPRPTCTRPMKNSTAPGGCPATWIAQLSGCAAGIRSTYSLSIAGTSVTSRAVTRYSCWLAMTLVRPEVPSTSASASSQASEATYATTRSRRHDQVRAQASARQTPNAARSRAGTVPGPTFACQKPWVGGAPSESLRASTSQPARTGTVNEASRTTPATPSPAHARTDVLGALMAPSLGAGR